MKVAIVGTGITGITLALRLQQLGVATTVLAEQPPDEQRAGRLQNLVARFPATRDRERELGVAHWEDADGHESWGIEVDVVGTPLGFRGSFDRPASGVDFRVYLSSLTEDYVARGGQLWIEPLPTTEPELVARTQGHDVVVVAAGRQSPLAATLFGVRADRSPHHAPQRRLLGGLFRGIAPTDPRAVSFNIVPGAGEIFQQPFLTDRGVVAALLVEAVPGGPLEAVTRIDPAADRRGFLASLWNTIEAYAPKLAARVDPVELAPLGERDVLRGAVTPTVRRGWAALFDGRLALAIGDAWVVNDPVTGQGANIGSHCAWHTAAALATTNRIDVAFAQRLEDELWSFAGPVTGWTNAFLQPPPPHVLDLLGAATARQSVADAFANGFADPVRLAGHHATPEATAAFVADNTRLVEV